MPRTVENRHRDKEKTRSELMTAGAHLFAVRGFEGTSLDAITSQVGVNKALVSYYFKNKAGLYQAIVAENVRLVKAAVTVANIDDHPAEGALRIYIRALSEAMGDKPDFLAMIMREHISSAFMSNQASAAELLGFFMMTSSILKRGASEGVFKPVDHHLFHLNLIGSVVFFVATARFRQHTDSTTDLENPRPELEEFIRHTQDLLLGGLLQLG